MKRLNIYLILLLFQTQFVLGQSNVYNFVTLGKYKVGYSDSVIYDSKFKYEAFDYKGDKPHFTQIWYPIEEEIGLSSPLSFKELFEVNKSISLSNVHNELQKHYKEAIIRDCLVENLKTGDSLIFDSCTYSDIIDSIGEIKTKSFKHKIEKKLNYPVIVYHHGAQSFSFENYLMAEYFASRGFIFVSANFHLPFENKVFGAKPFNKIVKNEEEESLKSFIMFAKSLSSNSSVFFIGHSWGAQMGLRALDGDDDIKGFVSLETTIEFKEDTTRIKELWPEIYQKIAIEKTLYPYPIAFCASTGQKKPFSFFRIVNSKKISFVSTKREFEHNAYTSTFHLRYFINPVIKQTDKKELHDRLNLYIRHLEFIHIFLNDIIKNKEDSEIEVTFIK